MPFRKARLEDFELLDPLRLRRSSYKNLSYPLGCSRSELQAALGQADVALASEQGELLGVVRAKAILGDLCYLDVHLRVEQGAEEPLDDLLCELDERLGVGKFYVQLLAYEHAELACLKALDFTQEGVMREQVFVDGRYQDLLMMGSEDERV